jgi:hypothetical protein
MQPGWQPWPSGTGNDFHSSSAPAHFQSTCFPLGHLPLLFPPRAEPLLHAVVATVVIDFLSFPYPTPSLLKDPPIDHASCFVIFFLLSTWRLCVIYIDKTMFELHFIYAPTRVFATVSLDLVAMPRPSSSLPRAYSWAWAWAWARQTYLSH